MLRLRSSLALILLAAISLAQTSSPLANPRVRRVGDQLMCLCGCGATVTSCNMLHCHFSDPAREKIATMIAAGKSDSEIVDSFVQDHGKQILLKPPAEGFFLLGWAMPFIGLALGLLLLWAIVKRFRTVPAAAPRQADDSVLARYQDRIDEDLSKLE